MESRVSITDPEAVAPRPALSRRATWLWVAAVLVASLHHLAQQPLTAPLNEVTDLDGLRKLEGIAANASFASALGWFVGDDPQGVHTFRPLAALTLWAEFRLWGFLRWPYLLVNFGWLLLTCAALVRVGRRLDVPAWVPWLAAVQLAGRTTRGSTSVVNGIATRHDLVCVLACLIAMVALVDYLRQGGRRPLGICGLALLAALLAKEMALAMLPFFWAVAWLEVRRGADVRRAWRAAAGALAVGLGWFVWYKLAERNMGPSPHGSHTFGGMLHMLLHRGRDMTVQQALFNLAWYPADVARQLRAAGPLLVVWSPVFWKSVGGALITGYALWLLWRHARHTLVLVYLWKALTYLPVLPLHDVWGWYEYMPHVLDPLLPATVAWILWEPLAGGDRLRAWWRRHRELSAA